MRKCLASVGLLCVLMGCQAQPPEDVRPIEPAPDNVLATTNPTTNGAANAPRWLEAGWELVPAAMYSASQTPGEVILRASGEHPTAGYETKFVQSPLKIWPPQYALVRKRGGDLVAQVITPFEAMTTFKAQELVKAVVITDGAGRHEVSVDQARD